MLPKIVAIARDPAIVPMNTVFDAQNLPGYALAFGQDSVSDANRAAPANQSVGKTEAELKPKMQKLLDDFAAGDTTGMAKRLFDKFLAKQDQLTFFEDRDLNLAAQVHAHIVAFCNAALSAPGLPFQSVGKTRIHQALQQAEWDIEKIVIPTDLGIPAFNIGSKYFHTEDFNNGLGVMIDGVQYGIVVATKYSYGKEQNKYSISLRYLFYDIFGLDDTDLQRFGASSDSLFLPSEQKGITAWWQLQHQFGYKPVITRIVLEKSFEVQAK